jgi:hypothetical protein
MIDFLPAFDMPTVERLETTAQQNGFDRRLAKAELRQVAAY